MISKSRWVFNLIDKDTYSLSVQARNKTSDKVYDVVLGANILKIEAQVDPFGEQIKRNLKL